eukprot:gnl/MRDRNA2_/MRDRNA2_112023_c0_seq1.p2 gnl/MRDRNA2_/MRDRNA2_112023_c0~~gnl/MRDRNA2_/MRDRNA2_112023_c0_seq1.p2  ORF type:complete len:144 (+),score=27.47 gnl/MRDRNA2_/MRDRNA2_112023_c0_seq1:65-496(+)
MGGNLALAQCQRDCTSCVGPGPGDTDKGGSKPLGQGATNDEDGVYDDLQDIATPADLEAWMNNEVVKLYQVLDSDSLPGDLQEDEQKILLESLIPASPERRQTLAEKWLQQRQVPPGGTVASVRFVEQLVYLTSLLDREQETE